MQHKQLATHVAVIGGGMAGITSAIAAARQGARVVLVQDRPVLGGNASSEIRVWVSGAQGHTLNRFAREGGILNELLIEQLYRNPECSPAVWNAVLLDAVLAEPRITLLLDTAVDQVTMASPRRVASVSAYSSISETRVTISAKLFVDASGDSIVGGLAGADYGVGKEARDHFGEPTAPAKADPRCLGASLTFYSHDVGRPVPYVKPDFAVDVSKAHRIRTADFDGHIDGCRLWWIEYGGTLDTIGDSAEIKQHLTGIVHGFWDYLKNSGRYPETEALDLEWMGSIPGKRESRRLMGPHVLTEHDLFDQGDFADSCATGGWTIDHHPPGGLFDRQPPSRHITLPGPYNIPLRCLFSRNVDNLLMAGRNISVSNVAFGSTRVMGTGAACGQAAGTAAALCARRGLTPGELVADASLVEAFRQTLVRDDQHIYHVPNRDPKDIARKATVRASSELIVRGARPDAKAEPIAVDTRDAWLMVPVTSNHLDHVELLVDAAAATTMTVEVQRNDRRWHYFPNERVARRRVKIPRGRRQWVRVPLGLTVDEPGNLWFVVKKNRRLALHGSRDTITGLLSSRGSRREWPDPRKDLFAFRISPTQTPFAAANVTGGYARPYVLPNLWTSGERVGGRAGTKPYLELSWPRERRIGEVRLYLSHDPDMQIPTMMMHYPFRVMPTLLTNFSIYARLSGRMRRIKQVRNNHRRMVVLTLDKAIRTRTLRVVAEATGGSPRAEIYEVRIY
jgi:FAD-dependent oxidoreductase family protein